MNYIILYENHAYRYNFIIILRRKKYYSYYFYFHEIIFQKQFNKEGTKIP